MIKNKNAFTLAEVLICLTIIGIIMALSLNSIKIIRESYTSLGYYAFTNLQAMITKLNSGRTFHDQLITHDGTKLDKATTFCKLSSGFIISVLKSDDERTTYGLNCSDRKNLVGGNEHLFCESLGAIANTKGDVNCDSLLDIAYDTSVNNEPYMHIKLDTEPNFITTNGQRFYISKWDFNSLVSDIYGYRLVSIDLNATSRPNKDDYCTTHDDCYAGNDFSRGGNKLPPDIITFLILDNGEIFPLGVAADHYLTSDEKKEFRYITSQVKGYYYDSDTSKRDTSLIPAECGYGTSYQTCNYAVAIVPDTDSTQKYSYRKAYCQSEVNQPYSNYCSIHSYSKYNLCPPSSNSAAFDACKIYNVKPAFRFNFG